MWSDWKWFCENMQCGVIGNDVLGEAVQCSVIGNDGSVRTCSVE